MSGSQIATGEGSIPVMEKEASSGETDSPSSTVPATSQKSETSVEKTGDKSNRRSRSKTRSRSRDSFKKRRRYSKLNLRNRRTKSRSPITRVKRSPRRSPAKKNEHYRDKDRRRRRSRSRSSSRRRHSKRSRRRHSSRARNRSRSRRRSKSRSRRSRRYSSRSRWTKSRSRSRDRIRSKRCSQSRSRSPLSSYESDTMEAVRRHCDREYKKQRQESNDDTDTQTSPKDLSFRYNTKIIVVPNLCQYVLKTHLQTLFGYIGKIKDCAVYTVKLLDYETVVNWPQNCYNRNVGYVKFASASSTNVAVHLTNVQFFSRPLEVFPCACLKEIPTEIESDELMSGGIERVLQGIKVTDGVAEELPESSPVTEEPELTCLPQQLHLIKSEAGEVIEDLKELELEKDKIKVEPVLAECGSEQDDGIILSAGPVALAGLEAYKEEIEMNCFPGHCDEIEEPDV